MNYQFFIQGKDTGRPDQEFRLIMVLDTGDRDSLAQTSIQALITRHQMHTCVNIPFRYKSGHLMKFETGFAEMDGEVHPVLKIVTDKYGAFRLPFPSGVEGYRIFQKTYKEVRYRLIQHKNRHLNRLGSEPVHARRLEAPKHPGKTEKTTSTAQTQKTTRANPKPPHATQKQRSAAPAKEAQTKNWWQRQPESLRWMVGGLAAGIFVASVLFTGKAFAAETPTPTSDHLQHAELAGTHLNWDGQNNPAGCVISDTSGEIHTPDACSAPKAPGGASSLINTLPGLTTSTEPRTKGDLPALEAELLALGADMDEMGTRYAGFPVPAIVDAPKAQVVNGCSIPQASDAAGVEFSLPGLNQTNREI